VIAIIAGFLAVVSQSIFYLFVRRAQVHLLIPGLTVNVQMHWQLGWIAWPVAIIYWPDTMTLQTHLFALGVSVFYWVAQVSFFSALNRASSSQVAPLLALKLMVVGVGSAIFLSTDLSATQWQAVALATASAIFLSIGADRPPLRATLLALTTVLFFSVSDISLGAFIDHVGIESDLDRIIFVLSYCYGLNSLFTLPFRPWRLEHAAVKACITPAFLCLIAMVFLFTAFVLGGVVLGNLMLATRGLVVVFIGLALKPFLEAGVEPSVSWKVWMRRIISAIGMLISVEWFLS
jgi:drug/metabolite transporter (DMT)-like permease